MTTHMPDIQSLIERVEAATGPSYELDCAIWDAVYPGERQARFDALTAKGQPYHRRLGPADMDGYVKPLRSFTTSLDAAMTLVPRGWIVEIRRYFNNDGEFVSAASLTDSFTVGRGCDPEEEVTVSSRIVERRQGADPTPLALCAVALKARNPSHEG